MASKRFNLDPIPQPAAPARDRVLTASSDGTRALTKARLVPTDRLIPDPEQPRKHFTADSLQDLAASLSSQGMRQPITAYYDDSREKFVVISGERRLRAALLAGIQEVPVLLEHRPGSESDKLVLQLAENLVREDLTPLEAASALQRLKQLRAQDWKDVAARHGINERRAYQLLQLLDDVPELREALEGGRIREGHAAELRRVPQQKQAQLLATIVSNNLSVADTRALIAGVRAAENLTQPRYALPPASSTGSGSASAGEAAARSTTPDVKPVEVAVEVRSERGPTAGAVADAIQVTVPPVTASAAAAVGAAIVEEKARRERTRRLRQRLETITRELRNVHMDEVTEEYTALPEIIVQARQARDSLDAFIRLLERVQLDAAGAMEVPPH